MLVSIHFPPDLQSLVFNTPFILMPTSAPPSLFGLFTILFQVHVDQIKTECVKVQCCLQGLVAI